MKLHQKKHVKRCPLCDVEMFRIKEGIYICPICQEVVDEDKDDHIDPRYKREVK